MEDNAYFISNMTYFSCSLKCVSYTKFCVQLHRLGHQLIQTLALFKLSFTTKISSYLKKARYVASVTR